jgi:type IV pilus assembly protein PilM
MKHRQVGLNKVGVLNSDGHAIGVDIGATAVRAAVLAPGTLDGRPSVTVHGLGYAELPPGAVINGVVADKTMLTTALKTMWQVNKFECTNVILGIANAQVLVRDMAMPNVSADKQAKALPYLARDIVALPMDQVILDFAPLGEPEPGAETIPGLLLASPRQPILAAVQAAEAAGLKVARVDLASFAALRSIADEQLAVEAVVDLGAHLTTIVIHNEGVPRLVRTLTHGGHELTDRLIEHLSMTPQEAEAAKRGNGLSGPNADVARVLAAGIRPLLAEIRTSLGYFRSTADARPIERISLTGGASLLPGLAQTLESEMSMPTRLVSPAQHIRNRLASKAIQAAEGAAAATAVSVGLAMGAAA